MGPSTNAVPQRTTSHTEAEIAQFHETRRREVLAARELVDQLHGRASLLPAWAEVLAAAVPALQPIVERLHAARHPESPGGSKVVAGEAAEIAAVATRELGEAVLKILGSSVGPAPEVAPSVNPERAPKPPRKRKD